MDSIDYIFEECNPSGIKALLQKQAICSSNVRLPLVKATEKLEQKLTNFIDNY